MTDLLKSLANVIERAHVSKHHKIEFETLSIRERMSIILEKLSPKEQMHFRYLYTKEEGGMGVAVSLIAILELAKQSVLEVTQKELFADIYVRDMSNLTETTIDQTIEAALFAYGEPLSATKLQQLFPTDEKLAVDAIKASLERIESFYENRG